MDYQLHELGDGRVQVVYLEPVVIGVLADRRIAEKFAEFLTDLDRENQRDMAQFIRSDAAARPEAGATPESKGQSLFSPLEVAEGTVTLTAAGIDLRESPPNFLDAINAASLPKGRDNAWASNVEAHQQADAPMTSSVETPVKEAFRRIREGEALGVVADDMGIPMPRLRALWAQASKASAKADQIPAPADGPSALSEANPAPITLVEADCTGCGRSFRMAPDSDGLCARCHRQVAR